MEAQPEKPISWDVKLVDSSSSRRFIWTIDKFWTLNVEKLYSDIFNVEGYKWRILVFPKGNGAKGENHLSVYLDVADSKTLPDGWSKYVEFSLSVVSQNDKYTVKRKVGHKFNASESDWGFSSFVPLGELNDPMRDFFVRGACTIEAEIWFNEEEQEQEQDKTKLKREEKADSDKEPVVIKMEKSASSFANFDNLFIEIHNLLEENTSKAENLSRFRLPAYSIGEISRANKIFKQCLDMDLASIIQFGRAFELKYSLSILLSSNSFPDNKVDGITKFLADFDQSCEQYEAAQLDLSEAKEKEESIGELNTTMKKLSSEFLSIRNQAEAFEREISWLERQLTTKKAKNAKLRKRLEVLAGRATTSKQALISAGQDVKLRAVKKEEAEKVISDIEGSWESLKADHSSLL